MKFTQLRALVSRNCKVFFRDKGVFLPSLIAPLILLFLFLAFLGNVYRDSIRSAVEGFPISDGLVESIAGGWLISCLIAVCAVTIAFTANTIMVQDKARGRYDDLSVAPVPGGILALAYFLATFLVTALICFVALGAGFIYIGIVGWHLTAADVFLTVLDTLLLVLFGTSFSSVVCFFVSSEGGVAAVEATVSAAYGFLCGAYMPIGSFADGLQTLLSFLPGTYGTVLLHSHLMGSAIDAVTAEGLPVQLAEGIRSGFDCTISFFGSEVQAWGCYLAVCAGVLFFLALYLVLMGTRVSKILK